MSKKRKGKKITFGKYKGYSLKHFGAYPQQLSYMLWVLNQENKDGRFKRLQYTFYNKMKKDKNLKDHLKDVKFNPSNERQKKIDKRLNRKAEFQHRNLDNQFKQALGLDSFKYS